MLHGGEHACLCFVHPAAAVIGKLFAALATLPVCRDHPRFHQKLFTGKEMTLNDLRRRILTP